MELLKSPSRRRSHVTELIYATLNVTLAVAILLVLLATQSIWVALLLVLLSKWRVLAVRPRYWRANIQANTVDVIVGLSYVIMTYEALGALWLQIALTVAYIVWLLLIKPRSKRSFVVAQALTAVFLGINALAMVAYAIDVVVFVASMWVIGYAAARHILVHYEEPLTRFLSLVCGLFMAELGWFGYHWLFAYSLPGVPSFLIAQLALVAVLIAFLAERVYEVYHRNQKVRAHDIMLPAVFSVSLIIIMTVFFNQIAPAGSL